MLVHLPPDPPSAVDPTRITVLRDAPANGKMALTIKLADPPRAHPNAIDGYRLAVWSQWPDGSIEPANDVSGRWPAIADGHVAIEVSVPANAEATETLLLKLGIVDPAGRLGAIVNIGEISPKSERPDHERRSETARRYEAARCQETAGGTRKDCRARCRSDAAGH
jgi:hypothetical protein